MLPQLHRHSVTPFAGVWIEMFLRAKTELSAPSPPSRGCGLKSPGAELRIDSGASPPSRGCGLKCSIPGNHTPPLPSPPSRGCGLKSDRIAEIEERAASPPSRGCGLKCGVRTRSGGGVSVTPFAGVWIEIRFSERKRLTLFRHPLRGGVD